MKFCIILLAIILGVRLLIFLLSCFIAVLRIIFHPIKFFKDITSD